ncbi:hypothetical protein HPB50_008524 [Hyalomma asiaticum]|uniref:Uncharacterized protein n=1 Tax=Hyalomma asiaticum TaxID=266040 RepID=A0ACB7RIB0_HYAAI|nr:hypothetical protein HPB50_008524 [Hyalomma asiaticum]
MRGDKLNLNYAEGTAHFINLILKWWHVVNVKSPSKGRRLRDPLQDPVRSLTGKQIVFLNNFLDWLDTWRDIKMDTGALSTETHSALRLTCYALVELCRYCLEELNFDYVLLGKFQTDSLEERFGQYRRLSGTNYHISIQQVFESEKKLRLQDSLVFPDMQELQKPCVVPLDGAQLTEEYSIKISDRDITNKGSILPVITYIAGFCANAALRKLPYYVTTNDGIVIAGHLNDDEIISAALGEMDEASDEDLCDELRPPFAPSLTSGAVDDEPLPLPICISASRQARLRPKMTD